MTCTVTRSKYPNCYSLFCLWDYDVNTSRVMNACYVHYTLITNLMH